MSDKEKKVEEKTEDVPEVSTDSIKTDDSNKSTSNGTGEKKEEAPKEVEVKENKSADEVADGEEVKVPAQFKKLIEEVEKMTVLELHELVKVLEKKFGVSAAAVAVAPGSGGGGEGDGDEKDSFTVELTGIGDQKIAVIKAVKGILALGLKEAKDMVDGAPTVLKEDVKKEDAEEIKKKIEEAGGKVTLK